VKRKFWKRIFIALISLFVLCLILLAHPVFHLIHTVRNDRNELIPPPPGRVDDASRLDETRVAQIWNVPPDMASAEKQLAALLQFARTNRLKISIAGARHSMGGHAIFPDGIMIDMLPFNRMELDGTKFILHVQAGARWSEIVPFLNAQGLSVAVMQSNDDFSVGGSLSVNCHGWQFDRPPIASTVESFRLMQPDGNVVRCSRTENRELFSLALGGYGLFGIILDVDLRVVPNEQYVIERIPLTSADFAGTLKDRTGTNSDVAMAYGRLRVTEEHFLQEGILNLFHRLPSTNRVVSTLAGLKYPALQRAIFRGGMSSDYGKQLRWDAEKFFSSALSGDVFDRNAILEEPSAWFQDRSTNTTDILVECFVPPGQFEPLLADLRTIIPRHHADLLNVTVRDVNRDDDTFLRYADTNLISLVMLFSQKRSVAGNEEMSGLTQEIVTAALLHHGRYYLPYRLHATPEQFARAYPQASAFFELKRKYDPDELFQNEFYLKYGKP
jgi:FAD/FMN-containing dehydrogenase